MYLSIRLSVFLQVWKQSYSARLPQFLNLTTLKTKQVCKTSSIFEVDNIKNEALLGDLCRADGLVPMRFAIFPVYVSKVLRLPRKIDARPYEVLHLSRKIISANLNIWCSKMQPVSGNQRPDLLTALMNMSLVLRLPRKMHLCRSSSNVPRLLSFLEMLENLHVLLTFDKVTIPCTGHAKRHLNPKVVRTCSAFHILTSKCASRHNGVHFFDISTSRNGLHWTWCVLHILTWKCASRQNGVHFFDISTSKSGPNMVLCAFWLRHVLRAAIACILSTSKLPKVLRTWCALYILTWTCASHHNGVQFFISHLASVSWLCHLFAHLHLLSSDSVFSLIFSSSLFCSSLLWLFPPLLFHLSILSEVWLLNFLRL